MLELQKSGPGRGAAFPFLQALAKCRYLSDFKSRRDHCELLIQDRQSHFLVKCHLSTAPVHQSPAQHHCTTNCTHWSIPGKLCTFKANFRKRLHRKHLRMGSPARRDSEGTLTPPLAPCRGALWAWCSSASHFDALCVPTCTWCTTELGSERQEFIH